MRLTQKTLSLAGIFLMIAGMTSNLFAAGNGDNPSGQTAQTEKTISNGSEIAIEGISQFTIGKSDKASISISGDKAFVNKVTVVEEGNYLSIMGNPENPVEVTIMVPELESLILTNHSVGAITDLFIADTISLSAASGSSLTSNSIIEADKIIVNATGSASISAKLDSNSLIVKTRNGGFAGLSGTSSEVDANFSNASADFSDMNIQNAEIIAESGSDISADFTGNSVVSISLYGESTMDLEMNGLLDALVANDDSSLNCTGNIEWIGKYFI